MMSYDVKLEAFRLALIFLQKTNPTKIMVDKKRPKIRSINFNQQNLPLRVTCPPDREGFLPLRDPRRIFCPGEKIQS